MPESAVTPKRDFSPDVTVIGAGLIGSALALELHLRGARVTVLERGNALEQASIAAAGMLAAHDPHNPPELLPLSELSLSLYPAFLGRIAELSGIAVAFQTDATIQYLDEGGTVRLAEHSLDPRQLATAVLAAVRATGIDLREHTPFAYAEAAARGETACTATGDRIATGKIIHASGAWTSWSGRAPLVTPRKGQMLRVTMPPALRELREVHRSREIYVVPRIHGPQAGTALIGATVEDAGFDTTTSAQALRGLRRMAAEMLPELADDSAAPQAEAWAGLRPATPDLLPVLGRVPGQSSFFATGHFRNGILLAPATAAVIADLVEGKTPRIDLGAFSPARFVP